MAGQLDTLLASDAAAAAVAAERVTGRLVDLLERLVPVEDGWSRADTQRLLAPSEGIGR